MKKVLAFNILTSEEIPDEVQHTKERKPDALKKLTDASGTTYLLHLEFRV